MSDAKGVANGRKPRADHKAKRAKTLINNAINRASAQKGLKSRLNSVQFCAVLTSFVIPL